MEAVMNGALITTMEDVRYAYRLLLGREPDAEGLAHHFNEISKQSLPPPVVARILMDSDECRARSNASMKLREVHIEGVKIYPWRGDQLIGDSLSAEGEYEPNVLPVFLDALRQGDYVLDVGANIGIFTLLAAKRIGSQGRVYAFEPVARNVQSLCAGIIGNGFTNIALIPVAASDRAGAVSMHPTDNSSNGIVDVRTLDPDDAAMAPINRIDSLLHGIERLDVIKIDIEGFEPRAWRGIRALVVRFKPLIFSEFNPVAIGNTLGLDPREYLCDLLEVASAPIEVLHRDGSVVACKSDVEIMSEWRGANERIGLDGALHLDLRLETGLSRTRSFQ